MHLKKFTYPIAIIALLLVAAFSTVSAQDTLPTVEVADQVSVDGTVMIARAVSDGPGFIVIHADNDGTPGEVLGWRQINAGENNTFSVPVDFSRATPALYAMLHYDNSVVGEYEFDGTPGIDGPVIVDDVVISPSFQVNAISTNDSFVSDDSMVMIDSVVTTDNGWLVVHADNGEGAPGPVIGVTFVEVGLNTNVPVELTGEPTNTLFPMLHEDTGEDRTYEFGNVDGADLPVIVDGVVATSTLKTVPNIVATQQVVTDTFVADTVLSDGPGWLVIHADNNGAPGPVIGAEFVEDGLNTDVEVSLNTDAGPFVIVHPMLHTDTGEVGTYEFGDVEGADGPVTVDGEIVMFPMLVAPSMTASDQPLGENSAINVATALIDAPGWLVVHADNGEGAPGPVLGQTPLLEGLNENVGVLLDGEITETVYPMLHYDTGEMGVYEFGEVEGADGPVTRDGSPIVLPITLQ
jgi:hypothetical protein